MAAKYTAQWIASAKTAAEFARRLKAWCAHQWNTKKNVVVTSDNLGYHGYVAFKGASLERGFEQVRDRAYDIAALGLSLKETQSEFAFWCSLRLRVPKGTTIPSGAFWTEPADGFVEYRAQSHITRNPGSIGVAVDTWTDKHNDPSATVIEYRYHFASTAGAGRAREVNAPSPVSPLVKRGQASKPKRKRAFRGARSRH